MNFKWHVNNHFRTVSPESNGTSQLDPFAGDTRAAVDLAVLQDRKAIFDGRAVQKPLRALQDLAGDALPQS